MFNVQRFQFELTGVMPILLHANDIAARQRVEDWINRPGNKKNSKAGDDRFPAWKWQTYLYSNGEHIAIPSDNIMSCIGYAAKSFPTGKRGENFMRETQISLMIDKEFCEFEGPDGPVRMADVVKLEPLPFAEQAQRVKHMGFSLFMRPVGVNGKSHVRVRPRFEEWKVSGVITLSSQTITEELLRSILEFAGRQSGLGDWRPSSKKPGPFGRFEAKLKRIK